MYRVYLYVFVCLKKYYCELTMLAILWRVYVVKENAGKLCHMKECHFLINTFSCNCFFVFPLSLKYRMIIQPETNRMSTRIKM